MWIKRLGVFTERSVEIHMLKFAANSNFALSSRLSTQIGIFISGAGQIEGEKFRENSAFSLQQAEVAKLRTDSKSILLLVGLPLFEEAIAA